MQVLEFHFNPRLRQGFGGQTKESDLIFDTFCYEPENIYEKKLGSLCIAGLLRNTLPKNVRFLDSLNKLIKEKYYRITSSNPEKSLKETLKKANEFLEKIAKEGDVSWLGNLSFGVITLSGFELNFTKVGDLKILLLRRGQVIDIERELKFEDIEPYPLRVFGNIVSGKLADNDIILVLTKEVFDCFQGQNVIKEIAKLSSSASSADVSKNIKAILNQKREQLSKIFGICLLIVLNKEGLSKKREILNQSGPSRAFSLKLVFSPVIAAFGKLIKKQKSLKTKPAKARKKPEGKSFFEGLVLNFVEGLTQIFRLLKFRRTGLPKLKPLGWKFPKLGIFQFNKNTLLILALILFLASGFFIFKQKEEEQLKIYQTQLIQIKESVEQANSYLIIAKTNPEARKKANSLLIKALEEISPLSIIASNFSQDFNKQVSELKTTILEYLFQLNKLEIIQDIQPFFEFKSKDFIPQKLVAFRENLYFFNSFSENIFEVNSAGEGRTLSIEKKIDGAASQDDSSILFFSKPNQLIVFKDGQFKELLSLEPPSSDFNFTNFSSYSSNLYFLDTKTNDIIKYSYLNNFRWSGPQSWLDPKIRNAIDFKTMATDGSVWILNKKNGIARYYTGGFRENLNLEIFPPPKDLTKIFTSSQLPYLYLLEPAQKRIIILNKSGEVIKQFQSEKFDNLLDFTVSQNGKIIWLLNGLRVYKITTELF